MKGIFDTKPDSGYDDHVAQRYHIPPLYLGIAEQFVSDWVIFRETQRNRGRRAYVAVARVQRLDPDPERPGHHYAVLADYLPFDRPVPLAGPLGYREEALRQIGDRLRVGAYLQGKSVRPISELDFAAIAHAGLAETLLPNNGVRLGLELPSLDPGTQALLAAAPDEQERRVVEMLVNRKIRDASFRGQVCEAYDDRCAVTRLRIVNGGGRAEVQAAHIWPVTEGGPDVVQNGIALSATVHWLFDRHLISLTDDYGLLVSHNKVPTELRELFARQEERIHLPADPRLWPKRTYLQRHRDAFAGR